MNTIGIGEVLRTRRMKRGLSLRVTAELAGLSPAFLSMVENGRRRLNRHRDLMALADVLNIDPRQLTE
ncbi:helix-turn-helix domain-containing protein [Streptomyces hainanensis]|uniref:helix-turn-helix domain-containing protein n=1 Tax=Streptomyces hainanensis TaxID=402648 RepID=UPI001FB6F508|nr:helix-turn-helix transcriptional regulator [Streptomyces hainanensis]